LQPFKRKLFQVRRLRTHHGIRLKLSIKHVGDSNREESDTTRKKSRAARKKGREETLPLG
jgi:hypothetical protein